MKPRIRVRRSSVPDMPGKQWAASANGIDWIHADTLARAIERAYGYWLLCQK